MLQYVSLEETVGNDESAPREAEAIDDRIPQFANGHILYVDQNYENDRLNDIKCQPKIHHSSSLSNLRHQMKKEKIDRYSGKSETREICNDDHRVQFKQNNQIGGRNVVDMSIVFVLEQKLGVDIED